MFDVSDNPAADDSGWAPVPAVDRQCFACGSDNDHGLQMRFEIKGDRLRSRLFIEERFRGWSNLLHGGVISTILDETMSWTVICLTRKFMLTKGMQVRFHRPIRVGTTAIATGYISARVSEKRVMVVAEITDEDGKICASSEGEFSLFNREQFLKMGIMPEEDLDRMAAAIA